MNRDYSKESLEPIVLGSRSLRQVCIKLGIGDKSNGNYRTVKKYINIHGIDISHFFKKGEWKKGVPQIKRRLPLNEFLVSGQSSTSVKKRLISEGLLEEKCNKCNQGNIWKGERIVIQLHHIDGVVDNNNMNNLVMLCPNCHSQANNYGSKNRRVA